MKTILKKHFVKAEDDIQLVIAEIICDTEDDLPETDEFEGIRLHHGSVAWVIATGDFYGLASDGSWINQTSYDESADLEVNSR